ncbi:adult-specific rigid cuticular protein 15.7-like [Brevipalpus obovatus]|uniref:adult-specific rigid cuticular protein 15.7-like n=1 Tax=Brevipalpus obovatus TaxID=246614 RepID=UPI003D9E915C
MKIVFCFALCFGIAVAGVVPVGHVGHVAAPSTGKSHHYRHEDGLGNSAFGYEEAHAEGASARTEQRTADGKVVGQYSLADADGRQRVVKYVADEFGFRVAMDSNEPGVAAQSPAAVNIGLDKIPDPVIPIEEPKIYARPLHATVGKVHPYVHSAPIYASHHGVHSVPAFHY